MSDFSFWMMRLVQPGCAIFVFLPIIFGSPNLAYFLTVCSSPSTSYFLRSALSATLSLSSVNFSILQPVHLFL